MARSYSQDELLRLRESPLVCKPANLPSVEEWMGPIPDQTQVQNQNQRRTANRGRNEEAVNSDGTTSRRPPLDGKARSANVTEDIILGPPKTAFASASGVRNGTKTFESPNRSSLNNHEDSSVKNDRKSVREKYTRDVQKDGEPSREPKVGPSQNRRSVKDDSALWSGARQQRPSGLDDGERPYRRNGDRGHDKEIRVFENHRRESDREVDTDGGTRRQGAGRGRNEPSWYRDEARSEERAIARQESKPRDWQDRDRGGVGVTRWSDRDRAKGVKADLDPEWMGAPESETTNQIHTQEDFERWKERMKSGTATKSDPKVENRASHDRTGSGAGSSAAKAKVDTPLVVDSSVDGFFGLWNQPKSKMATENQVNGLPPTETNAGSKTSKPSKFTGFFNPRPEPEPPKTKSPPPLSAPAIDSSNEDKQGFQRILKLLGQQQQHHQPQQQQPQGVDSVPPPHAQQERDAILSPEPTSRDHDIYSKLAARSPPANARPQGRDSEFLLKLMQQPQQLRSDLNQGNSSGRRAGQDATSGLLPLSNLMISPHDTPQQTPSTQPAPGFFDDLPARDKLNPGAERRAALPPGFFESSVPRPSPAGVPQQSQFPLGIQRPPGLDQIPPGYAQNAQSQRQNMVPPGFQAPTRGQNNFPPGLTPNDRLHFGIPATGRGMPPPGFMHPAPPGFPLPFGQEGIPYGGFGEGGVNFGHGFPPGQQRR